MTLPEFIDGVKTSDILSMMEFLIKRGLLIGIPTDRKSYKSKFTPEELIDSLVKPHDTNKTTPSWAPDHADSLASGDLMGKAPRRRDARN